MGGGVMDTNSKVTTDQLAHGRAVLLLMRLNPGIVNMPEFMQHIRHIANHPNQVEFWRMMDGVREEVARAADGFRGYQKTQR